MLDAANERFAAGAYFQCFEVLTVIIEVDPEAPVALDLLGHLFQNGLGVPKDYTRAQEYFQQTHAAGVAVATSAASILVYIGQAKLATS